MQFQPTYGFVARLVAAEKRKPGLHSLRPIAEEVEDQAKKEVKLDFRRRN